MFNRSIAESTGNSNQRGKAKIATILSVAIFLPFAILLFFAFFIASNSPFNFLFRKDNFNYQTQLQEASKLYKSNQWEKAMPALEEITATKPKEPLPYYMLAETYARLGHADKAVEQYKATLERKPDFHQASASLASLYLRLGMESASRLEREKAADYFMLGGKQIEQAMNGTDDPRFKDVYEGIKKQLASEMNKVTQ